MTYSYALTEDERACAEAVAKRRRSLNGGQSNFVTETMSSDDRDQQDFRAVSAEIAVSRLLNLCWTGCGKGALVAVDVGHLVEVRSINSPTHGLQVSERDEPRSNNPITLCLVTPTHVQFMGWEFISEVFKQGRKMRENKPFWVLPQSKLRHFDELKAYVLEWLWSKN